MGGEQGGSRSDLSGQPINTCCWNEPMEEGMITMGLRAGRGRLNELTPGCGTPLLSPPPP